MLGAAFVSSASVGVMSDSPRAAEQDVTVRDPRGRDTRIHGMVLNERNPGPTLRELLRQWVEVQYGRQLPGDLLARTEAVLDAIGPDGTAVISPGKGEPA